jgi:hypothetical protein
MYRSTNHTSITTDANFYEKGPWLLQYQRADEGVLKKLSLACLAKLSRLMYSWLRFGLASESTIGQCAKPANSQLIPQIMMKYLGLARLA